MCCQAIQKLFDRDVVGEVSLEVGIKITTVLERSR